MSFTIPYTVGEISFDKILCDVGASVNPMPLFVYKRLGIREINWNNITL